MGRKKVKNSQPSTAPVPAFRGDSSDSNDKNVLLADCSHITKSVDQSSMAKGLKNFDNSRKNFCVVCLKEKRPLRGDELLICLKCGAKTCCREDSKAHFDIPRSDSHFIAYNYTTQKSLCFGCKGEIDENEVKHKKLAKCVTSLNRQMSNASRREDTVNVKTVEKNEDKADSTPSPPSDDKKRKGGKQPYGKSDRKTDETPTKLLLPVRGLSNLGNTCYFNSVVQCLARTESLIKELKEMDQQCDVKLELKGGDTLEGCLEKWDTMSECLYNTLTSLVTPGPVLVPSTLLNFVRRRHPQFEGHDQHDAQELLRYTLDCIRINDLKRYRRLMLAKKGLSGKVDPKEVPKQVEKELKELEHEVTQVQTFIPEKSFKGKLVSRVKCGECDHSSEYIESFLDLSLPVLADKPHPRVPKGKIGHATPEPNYEEHAARKRHQRQVSDKPIRKPEACGDSREEVDEVAIEAEELPERLADSLGIDEDKPHESGYSSEKASSSLRASPSSEEMKSSSPCEDWSPDNQFTSLWFSSLPDVLPRPAKRCREAPHNLVFRPPTSIPLRPDGTPDLSNLSLYDSMRTTLNPLCVDTSTIMKMYPDWRSRINQRYFDDVDQLKDGLTRAALSKIRDLAPVSPGVECHTGDNQSPDSATQVSGYDEWLNYKENESDLTTTHGHAETKDECRSRSLGEVGRSVSPPLRKVRAPHVKRDSDFSPVKEEENEAQVDQLPAIQETCLPPLLHSDVNTQSPKDAPADTTRVEDVSDSNEAELRITDQTHSSDLGREDGTVDQGNTKYSDWSSLRTYFSAMNEGGANKREGSQTVHNNSVDSDGNESANEKSMNTCSEEFPEEAATVDVIATNERICSAELDGQSELPDVPVGGTVAVDSNNVDCDELRSIQDSAIRLSKEFSDDAAADGRPQNENQNGETRVQVDTIVDELTTSIANVSDNDIQMEPLLFSPIDPANDDSVKVAKENRPNTNSANILEKNDFSQRKRENRELSEFSIESCLRQFTAVELMVGSNKVGCSACTERQNKGAKDGATVLTTATKRLLIGQAPPVLILHLKRFQVQLHSFRKLTKHVSFPLILDMAPFCTPIGEDKLKMNREQPIPYSLYGIVEHRGTLNSGHYVAYVKVEDGNKCQWFCISDSHVDEVTEERVLKSEAYLLFYSRTQLSQ